MNVKAEKFVKMLEENKIACFEKQEVKDDLNTVLFRSFMEIEGVQLPVIVVTDDSIFTLFRTLVSSNGVNDKNRAQVVSLINKLNCGYKAFKYLVSDNGEIILDACMPASNEYFDPNLIRAIIDIAIKNLSENYRSIVKATWGEEVK